MWTTNYKYIFILFFIFLGGCVSHPIPEVNFEKEQLYGKNGNMICGAQGLVLSSSEVVPHEKNDIFVSGDSIDSSSAKYTCSKAMDRSEICKVNFYAKIDRSTVSLNRTIGTSNIEIDKLQKQYNSVFKASLNSNASAFDSLNTVFYNENYAAEGKVIQEKYNEIKQEILKKRAGYENEIESAEKEIYACQMK